MKVPAYRTTLCLFALALSVDASGASLTRDDYITQFRTKNPTFQHWDDDDVLDNYAQVYAADLESHPVLAKHAADREKKRSELLAKDNDWKTRSIFPWETPPIAVKITYQVRTIGTRSTPMPVVVITNTSKKTLSRIEGMLRINGVITTALICPMLAPQETRAINFDEFFPKQSFLGRRIRFICVGYAGAADVMMELDAAP